MELKILKARCDGLSFCELEGTTKRVLLDQIMIRGAAICGCDLPQTEMFAEIISEEIADFLLEFGYEELTLAEILLALKANAYGKIRNPAGEDLEQVSFTGNFMNLHFLGKVLKNYQVLRTNLDRKIENQLLGY